MDMLVKHVLKVGWGPGEAKKKERSLPCVLRALTLLQIQTCLDEKSTKAWSSLDKGESDNFPIQQKDRLFCKAIFLILFAKTTQLIVEWGSYLASQ